MDKKKLGLWVPIVVLAAALVVLAVSTGEVDAARGGKGGGKPGGSSAAMSVSPNPAPSGSLVVISGSGFAPNTMVQVGVSGYIPFDVATTDGSGAFTHSYSRRVVGPCSCRVEAWGASGNKFVMLTSTTLTVLSP